MRLCVYFISFYHKPQVCKSITQSRCMNSFVMSVVNRPAKGLSTWSVFCCHILTAETNKARPIAINYTLVSNSDFGGVIAHLSQPLCLPSFILHYSRMYFQLIFVLSIPCKCNKQAIYPQGETHNILCLCWYPCLVTKRQIFQDKLLSINWLVIWWTFSNQPMFGSLLYSVFKIF